MKIQSIKKGFTLIELLVVITIIGILATGGVSIFTTQLQGARDSTRISDMKLMETGIYQFFNDQGSYPPESGFTGSTTGIRNYLSKELKDPRGTDNCWASSTSNTVKCGGYYNQSDDGFGLTNSSFKLGITFEKNANLTKATNDGGTGGTTHNPNKGFVFETFAGAGAQYIFTGPATGGVVAVPASLPDVQVTMSGSNTAMLIY